MGLDLEGRVAIVTGGASGVGEAAVRAFVSAGARVVVADSGGEAAGDVVMSPGGDEVAAFVVTDVTNADSARTLVQTALDRFGRLDIAFNNAEIRPAPAALADQTAQEFGRVLAVNLRAVFDAMRAQIPAMLAIGGGSIINTSSVLGILGAPMESAYVTSKHAVIGLTRGAATDYAARGIRVNAVLPGLVGVPTSDDTPVVQANPARRAAEPGEVAEVVLWLASDRSSYVTGAAISVDGGATATL